MIKKQRGFILLSTWLIMTAMVFSVLLATEEGFVQQRVGQSQMERLQAFFLAENALRARLLSLKKSEKNNFLMSLPTLVLSPEISVSVVKNTRCFQSVVAVHAEAQYDKARVSLLAWRGDAKKPQSARCEPHKQAGGQSILWRELYT